MFVTTKISWSMITNEILEHEGYEYEGAIELACGPSSGQKAAATASTNLANQMTSQAGTIFGADNSIFNNMLQSYQSIVSAGPSQQGFSQAELNSLNSQAITNNANQFRNVAGATKAGEAGFGGGNTVSTSGAATGANLGVAQAAAANTANQLNQITQADYAQGNENYFKAAAGEQGLSNTFNSATSAGQAAVGANAQASQEQNQLAAQQSWWEAPVMSLASAGLGLATGGLSSLGQPMSVAGGSMPAGTNGAAMGLPGGMPMPPSGSGGFGSLPGS